jgi:hypothetical protein
MAQKPGRESRKATRYGVSCRVMYPAGARGSSLAFSANMSTGGLFLRSAQGVGVNDELLCEVFLVEGADALKVRCLVRHVGKSGAGLEFARDQKEVIDKIRRYLAEQADPAGLGFGEETRTLLASAERALAPVTKPRVKPKKPSPNGQAAPGEGSEPSDGDFMGEGTRMLVLGAEKDMAALRGKTATPASEPKASPKVHVGEAFSADSWGELTPARPDPTPLFEKPAKAQREATPAGKRLRDELPAADGADFNGATLVREILIPPEARPDRSARKKAEPPRPEAKKPSETPEPRTTEVRPPKGLEREGPPAKDAPEPRRQKRENTPVLPRQPDPSSSHSGNAALESLFGPGGPVTEDLSLPKKRGSHLALYVIVVLIAGGVAGGLYAMRSRPKRVIVPLAAEVREMPPPPSFPGRTNQAAPAPPPRVTPPPTEPPSSAEPAPAKPKRKLARPAGKAPRAKGK